MHSGAQSAVISKYLIVLGITGAFLTECAADLQFVGVPLLVQFLENTPNDTTLFILRATDTENNDNKMDFSTDSAETAEYINLIPTSYTQTAEANVTLKKKLDRELGEGFIDLKFSLSDTHNTIHRTVRLYILDVCDEAPQFTKFSYTLEINETNENESRQVYTEVHATDKDNGINGVVNYTMVPKTESSYWRDKYRETFSMNSTNGYVFLLKDLDFEENSFYQFTVYADDPCNLTALIPADLSIRVKDVQDQPPFFVGLPYMKSKDEGNYNHEPLLNVTAFDGDRGIPNAIEYFINKSRGCSNATDLEACNFCYDLFSIDPSTGSITVTGYLDWEQPEVQRVFGICTITVEAKENDTHHETLTGDTVSNTTVTLTIVDTNNHGPQFANKSYTARIRENAVKNTPVIFDGETTGINVSDNDQGSNSRFSVKLSCESLSDCDTFEVVPAAIIKEGILTIRVNNSLHLDYETRRNITITVIATDETGKINHTDNATLVVQIENENEYAPVFHNETYEVSIKEGSANRTSVINITATDEDSNGSDVISYSLSGGDNYFSVNSTTGEVVTNCVPKDLDREHLDKIYLRLTATDGDRRMSQTQLIVNLLDVNDNPPVFQASRYTAILDENSTTFLNESFLTVKATDIDDSRTNNSKVSYEFRNVSDLERNFIIDSENGEIRLASKLDYEALNNTLQGVINLTIFAYNDHSDQEMVGNATVSIFVQDVNDNVPQFSQIMYYGTVKETAQLEQIKMDTAERRRIVMVYIFAIEITALLFPSCAAIPQFDSQPQHVQVYENNGTGSVLFTLSASNSDSNEMTIFTTDLVTMLYVNITQGSKTSRTTANITLIKELDRESYEGGLELKFSLSDTKGNMISKTVWVYILDVCDEKPVFEKSTYTLEIEEINTTESKLVFSGIHATDRDNGNNAVVTYTMEPKTESEYWKAIYNETFKIDPANGGLSLLKNLDYENNSFYQFTLHAQDPCGLTAVPANLTIRVKDVQDKPPFFIGLPYMRIIEEGNYSNFHILRVEAFDGDLGIPNTIKYSLNNTIKCSDDDKGCVFCKRLFAVNSSTGDITVTGNLDWEMKEVLDIYGTCNIEVEAEEIQSHNVTQHGNTKSKTNITVTIQDENNHAPRFANTSYTATIQENANANTPILLGGDATGIAVADKDQGPNSMFSVTLKCLNAEDCETFAVVPSIHVFSKGTLTIRVNNSSLLDYEERQNMAITVIATEDNNSSHTDTATVIVRIENVNEFSPVFEKETYEAWIKEGSENGTHVIYITATDNDTQSYGEVTYSLSGGSNLFSVNNETGQVLTNCQPWQLDREQILKIYLTIIAKDGGGRMNQAQIVVHLDDINDNPPVFQQEIYTAFLEENSTKYKNTTLLTVKATDADQNGTENSEVSYTIGNTTWNSNFTIDNLTGEIRLESELDYEALNDTYDGVINLTVFAFDRGTSAKSGNVTVTIYVQDMNDNAPLFSTKTYSGTIRETATSGTFVEMVSATDADKTERNNKISFAIEAGGFDNFRINSTTGNVTVQIGAHFDRDSMNLYNLTIIAIDQGANSFTATATMSVTITDVNNKPPNFNQSSYSISTPENMSVGSFLTSCIATDPDENKRLNYSINNTIGWDDNGRDVNQSVTESYVRVYENNGTLYVNSALDRETVEKLVMIIFVTDDLAEEKKPQIATATVTIMVLDSDDSPPQFTLKKDFRVGMKRNMEPDKEIFELKSYVTDKDTPQNGIDKWIFQNVSFEITSELKNKLNGLTRGRRCSDPICVTGNGTIVNNMYYTQEMSGFFNVTVLVKDDAGNDTAYILIFLIADSQVLKMTIDGIRTNIAMFKDEILSECSNVTGLLFVYDSIADHKADDGTVDTLKTDLFFHIQDHKKNKVLSAEEAKRLLDEYADKLYYARMRYKIVSIESSLKSGPSVDESSKTIYVLVAVVALLTLVVLIVGYMFFSSSSRYKRKLRAAMPTDKEINIKRKDEFITPGSNMYAYKENPLLNTVYAPPVYEENDATSHDSLDTNDVDDAKLAPRGELEEMEVTLDMYGEDYFCVSKPTEDPLEAALREHDAQNQASIHELGNSRVGHSENEADKEQMVTGFVNNGFLHDLELETSEI